MELHIQTAEKIDKFMNLISCIADVKLTVHKTFKQLWQNVQIFNQSHVLIESFLHPAISLFRT